MLFDCSLYPEDEGHELLKAEGVPLPGPLQEGQQLGGHGSRACLTVHRVRSL